MSRQDMYERIFKAPVQGYGNKITQKGEFVVRNTGITITESKMDLGLLWIVEFDIVKTSLPEQHPTGSSRSLSHWPMREKTHPGAIKNHIMASFGVPVNDAESFVLEKEQLIEIAEKNLLEGYCVALRTEPKISNKNGKPYCLHVWSPVEPGTSGCDVEL